MRAGDAPLRQQGVDLGRAEAVLGQESAVCWPVTGAVPRGVPSACGSMPGKAGTGTGRSRPAWVSHWIRPVSRTCGWSRNSA